MTTDKKTAKHRNGLPLMTGLLIAGAGCSSTTPSVNSVEALRQAKVCNV